MKFTWVGQVNLLVITVTLSKLCIKYKYPPKENHDVHTNIKLKGNERLRASIESDDSEKYMLNNEVFHWRKIFLCTGHSLDKPSLWCAGYQCWELSPILWRCWANPALMSRIQMAPWWWKPFICTSSHWMGSNFNSNRLLEIRYGYFPQIAHCHCLFTPFATMQHSIKLDFLEISNRQIETKFIILITVTLWFGPLVTPLENKPNFVIRHTQFALAFAGLTFMYK